MFNLTNDNKEIIRKYYYDMYKLKLEVNGDYESLSYEEVKAFIDYKIENYLLHENIISNFSQYIHSGRRFRKTKIGIFPLATLIKETRDGNLKSLEYIIRYYQIKYELNCRLNNLSSKEKIEEGKKQIEKVIRTYFENNMAIKLPVYVNNYVIPELCGISVSKNKFNNYTDDKRKILYNSYYLRAMKYVKYTGILTDKEFENYIFNYLKNKVDKYLDDKTKEESNLTNYINTLIGRLIEYSKDEEKTLIRYNRFFDNRYEDTLIYLYSKYKYLLYAEMKANNITSPLKIIKYEEEFKKIIDEYLDKKIHGFCYIGDTDLRKNLKRIISENETRQSKFDYCLVRNGNKEEKEEQRLILLEEFSYFKEHFKKKFIYYTDANEVENRIEAAFESIVDAYINGNSTKEPVSYINTRMNQNLELFRKSKKSKFLKNDTEYLFAKRCVPIIVKYIEENELADNEISYFIEYCKNAFNYYVNSGSYKEDIRKFMFDTINSYEKEFMQEVSMIKKHLK